MDTVTPEVRSRIMARVKSKDTAPERKVRSALHALGYRFRLHDKALPGTPDIVLPKYATAIQVRGCFWHRHCCKKNHTPATRRTYWLAKLERNVERDKRNDRALRRMGWSALTVWECECATPEKLQRAIRGIQRRLERTGKAHAMKTKPDRLVVAIAQIPQRSDVAYNLRQIEWAMGEARADVVVFPECALTGYGPVHYESAADFDAAAAVEALKAVRRLAKRTATAVVMGTHLPLDGGWANSLLLIGPSGRTAARYDKAHLYGGDPHYYQPGHALPPVARAKGARLGLQICFDIRFPEPFRRLAEAGAEALIVPSHIHGEGAMWKDPVITGHVASRAAENGRFVIFANAAGATQNVPSMVANPRGEIVARARRGARRILTAELNLVEVNDAFLACRRTDLYA